MKNKALLLGLCYGITLPVTAFSQTACPLTDYERWDKYDSLRWNQSHIISEAKNLGFFTAFTMMEEDPTVWWVFAVEPGTKLSSIELETDKGKYSSSGIYLTTWAQRDVIPCPCLVKEDYEHQKIKGELYVVAFARFPVQPKGHVMNWASK